MKITKKYYIGFLIVIALLITGFAIHLIYWNSSTHMDEKSVEKGIKTARGMATPNLGVVQEALEKAEKENPSANTNSGEDRNERLRIAFSDAVILGDSITEGYQAYGYLSPDRVFSKKGASLLSADELFETAAATKPAYAFFCFGTNDMGNYSGNAKPFIKDYDKLVGSFKKSSPKTRIILVAIIPPTDAALASKPIMSNYKEFNQEISKMCKKKDYVFFSADDIFKNNDDLYEQDGVHFKVHFYPLMLEALEKKAGMI